MSEIKSTEYSTLRVSYEALNKIFRESHKNIGREIDRFKILSKKLELTIPQYSEIRKLVQRILALLSVLKLTAHRSISGELFIISDLKGKIEHLKMIVSSENITTNSEILQARVNQWKCIRVDRMVVDHLLQRGYYATALDISKQLGICQLTNVAYFNIIRDIEDSLNMHRTAKCLSWCIEHKAKLKKINSNLEFFLHIQEFVELLRANRRMDAMMYSRKYFPAFGETNSGKIERAMALLLYNPKVDRLARYEFFYDVKRWNELLVMFRTENCRVLQLPKESVLSAAIHAGLSALKTRQCYSRSSRNLNCPVCQEFNHIAENLPLAHYGQSRLMCRITKLPIGEHNPPMMIPNGQVFGYSGISEICGISKQSDKAVCPISGDTFSKLDKIEKVFIL